MFEAIQLIYPAGHIGEGYDPSGIQLECNHQDEIPDCGFVTKSSSSLWYHD